MSPYELIPKDEQLSVKATGMTRAGLLESAVKGYFAAAGPALDDDADEVTRPFALHGADFDALAAAVLDEAVASSKKHGEAYEAVKFDLITVMDAKGSFVGRPAKKFETPPTPVDRSSLKAERNAEGLWELTIFPSA